MCFAGPGSFLRAMILASGRAFFHAGFAHATGLAGHVIGSLGKTEAHRRHGDARYRRGAVSGGPPAPHDRRAGSSHWRNPDCAVHAPTPPLPGSRSSGILRLSFARDRFLGKSWTTISDFPKLSFLKPKL